MLSDYLKKQSKDGKIDGMKEVQREGIKKENNNGKEEGEKAGS